MTFLEEGVGYLEETECCDSSEEYNLPFKFKYLFSKDPCEKCLVRAACTYWCEPKYAKRDQDRSVSKWKRRWTSWINLHFEFTIICFVVSSLILMILLTGCPSVNHKQANQYYEQEVKNFPEENK